MKPAQAQAADVSDLTTSLRLPCPPRWVATLRPLLCGRLGFLGGGLGEPPAAGPSILMRHPPRCLKAACRGCALVFSGAPASCMQTKQGHFPRAGGCNLS